MISTKVLKTSIPQPLLNPAGLTIQILLCPLISYYGSMSFNLIKILSALSFNVSFGSSSYSSFESSFLAFNFHFCFFANSSFFFGSMYNQVVLQSIFFNQSECFYFWSYFSSNSSFPITSHSASSTNYSGKSFMSMISSKLKHLRSHMFKAILRVFSSIFSTSW